MSNDDKALVAFEPDKLTLAEVTTLKTTFAKGATDAEFAMFLEVCKFAGLNPFLRQVHFVKRGEVGTIQVGIDGYRTMAEETGEYAGQDEPTYQYNEDGTLNAATVRVYRKGWDHPIGATAFWAEYAQVFNGKLGNVWEKMPHVMLGKCAEALALRKAFPRRMSGVYTDEEMQQADTVEGKARVIAAPAPIRAASPVPHSTGGAVPAGATACPRHPDRVPARTWSGYAGTGTNRVKIEGRKCTAKDGESWCPLMFGNDGYWYENTDKSNYRRLEAEAEPPAVEQEPEPEYQEEGEEA